MNHTDSTTSTAAIEPMTAAAHGCTKAHGAVMATRPASMPLAIIPGSGLPVRIITQNMAIVAPNAAAMAVLVAMTPNRMSVAASVDAALKPNQPNSRMNVPSMAIGMWWAGERAWLAVLAVLADARSEHERTGEGGDAAHGVHDAGAGEVDVAEAGVDALAEAGQPAAAPRPRAEQRVVDRAAEQAPADERLPLPPLGHGARRDGGGGVHEGHHVEEEGQHAGRVQVAAAAEERVAPSTGTIQFPEPIEASPGAAKPSRRVP